MGVAIPRLGRETLQAMRVLVVDDNACAREITASIAGSLGLQVDTVIDGAAALVAVAQAEQEHRPYSLVLIDWKMPQMDGIETLRHLHAHDLLHVPASIMVTAYGREEALGEAMEAGEVVDAVIAQSHEQAKSLWRLREAPAEMTQHMHPPVNFDVSLPQVDIGRFADACRAAFDARWPGHHSLFFGHVGDGNLHVTTDSKTINGEDEQLEAVLYGLVQQFHGSVSAEHGIGLHKKPYLPFSRTPQELAIKAALDPLNLMNPGKVF